MTVTSAQVREPSPQWAWRGSCYSHSRVCIAASLAGSLLTLSSLPRAPHDGALPARPLCQACLWLEPLSVPTKWIWKVSASELWAREPLTATVTFQ